MDCIFCKIASGQIPGKIIFEDDKIIAFEDLNPLAPMHFLVIPKAHIMESADDVNQSNSAIIAHIFETIPGIVKAKGVENGYRIVTNCAEDAGQTVKHIHFHIIGGKHLGEMV